MNKSNLRKWLEVKENTLYLEIRWSNEYSVFAKMKSKLTEKIFFI